MNETKLLQGLHPEVQAGRLLPPDAAVRILVPLVKKNDPHRAEAVGVFCTWIMDRGQAVSVTQVAYLWENFRAHFSQEANARWQAWWRSSPAASEATSPLELARLEGNIYFMTVFKPWLATMRQTALGRLLVSSFVMIGVLGGLLALFLACWVAGAAVTELLRWLFAMVLER